MSRSELWENAVPDPLWRLPRITREGRRVIETVGIDGKRLAEAASEQQALLVDRCPPDRAAMMLCRAAPLIRGGIALVITVNDTSYAEVHHAADRCLRTQVWTTSHLMHDAHPDFTDAMTWEYGEYRLLLTAAESLRDHSPRNIRRCEEVLGMFVPMIAVIDPSLWLCTPRNGWEPAWVIRDLVARLGVWQKDVALVIFTEREAVSVGSAFLGSAFGVSGLVYLDGATAR